MAGGHKYISMICFKCVQQWQNSDTLCVHECFCLWEGADFIISYGHTKEQHARESVLFASNTASEIKLFSFNVMLETLGY